ncbi:hypothetical protein B0H17DRAFT_1169048 [Mycena rosella]|uniref:Thioredoxin domain-containing protein n=1 Tax=Mycena rosella TaxID=1033263 RepID=A0AAD7DHI5_MYCRO|nr:hypothetical protein B0H17DRAFT_1169048 [Mycena rosella]
MPEFRAALKPPLTPDNFKSTIAQGVWFVEHFPRIAATAAPLPRHGRSSHSRVKNRPGVQLAQVDCSVNGDLCDANGVKGYPQLNLYREGEFVEKYKGNRDFDVHASTPKAPTPKTPPPPPSPPPHSNVLLNPNGEVVALNPDNFQQTLENGPAFIKFYAPWCGHCKKLAPIWKQLAKIMQGRVTIAEVNCEAHEKFCKTQDVAGFPTLVYYPAGGPKSEYTSGRKLEQLKAFAEKASAPATQPIQPEEVDAYISENPVIYILLHPEGDANLIKTVGRLAAPLLGSPLIYTSSSPLLFKRYSVPETAPWAVVALKDRDPHVAAAMYLGAPSLDPNGDLPGWLLVNRLPTALELTQDTFQLVMNAPHAPLVVIAAVGTDTHDKVAERFREIALKWRAHTGGTGIFGGRAVVFTWMDAEKWASWMKSMYGLRAGGRGTDAEDVGVVIADHKVLQYYNTDQSDALIKLTSPSIFSALEGAATGTIKPKNSENFVERMARFLNAQLTATEAYIFDHPLHAAALLGAVLVLMYLAMRRCLGDDGAHDREYGYGKEGRMD